MPRSVDRIGHPTPPAPAIRIPGLDGLRAIAVALVLAYHLLPSEWVPSGMLGVDVFFVISGFLITSLLLDGRRRHPERRLADFWQRRARRILPALAVVVVIFTTAAGLFGKDAAVGLGWQVTGAATFTYNWLSIINGSGYFSVDTPELFRNLWSLAVEEQFYLVLPLVLPMFLLLRRPALRALAAGILAVCSAMWMLALSAQPGEASRAYLGTDSHAFGLLLGVALAFLLERLLARTARAAEARTTPTGWTIITPRTAARVQRVQVRQRRRGRIAALAGLIALAGIVVIALRPPTTSIPLILELAAALTGIVIVACVWPASWLGRMLDSRPMGWLGSRSYAVYLWHWPLLVLIAAGLGNDVWIAHPPLWLGLTTIALSLGFAELSFRFVETPMRRRGYAGTARLLGQWLRGGLGAKVKALGMLAAGVLLVATTTAAVASAPDQTAAQQAVAAGAAALRTPPPAPSPAPTHSDPASPSPAPSSTAPPPVRPVSGDEITAVGDSVMLASARGLLQRYPGIRINAVVSRQMDAAPAILNQLAQTGELRRFVVIGLGTNGAIGAQTLEELRRIIGPDRYLVFVNTYAPRNWIPGVNRALAAFAETHAGVAVSDWADAIGSHQSLLGPDHIHPGDPGGRLYTATLAQTFAEVQRGMPAGRSLGGGVN